MTPAITAPAQLPDLVRAAFVRARAAGDLTFFPTQVALLPVNGLPFQLRFAPSLARKPKAPKPAPSTATPATAPFDPFADPPPGLVVLPQLGSGHRLVLNKFAICQDHAILATTAFVPQHHLLAPADLAAAHACIAAYAAQQEDLFVFYNSGAHSGASQPHRHLQMLPARRMREGLEGPESDREEAESWGVLADRLADDENAPRRLPFFVAATSLPDGDDNRPLSPDALHAAYLGLYRQASAAAGLARPADKESESGEEQGAVPARLSYNLALTRRAMVLCPRRAEGGPVGATTAPENEQTEAAGTLSLNGTLLAGTALVKNAAEWDALRQDPGQLARVLRQIGVPAGGSVL